MRENKFEKDVQKTLNRAHLEKINEHNIEQAQIRVWNSLSHSINKKNNSSMEDSKLNTINSVVNKQSFWKKNKNILAIASVLVLIAGTSFGVIMYSRSDSDSDKVITTQVDDEKLKELAAARFEALTGLTYEDYQKLEQTSRNTSENLSAMGTGNAQPSEVFANTQTDRMLLNELSIKVRENQSDIYYSKSEYSFINEENGFSYWGVNGLSGVDTTKPLEVELWTSSQYNMTVVRQGEKIFTFSQYTPEYSLDYRGGDYGVKILYPESSGLFYYGVDASYYDSGVNPEVEFLKSIISGDSNIKNIGTVELDGRMLTIFEDRVEYSSVKEPILFERQEGSSPTENTDGFSFYSVKYYVDLEKLEIYQIEQFNNDELVSRVKTTARNKFEASEVDNIFRTDIVSNVRFEEIVSPNYSGDSGQLENFIIKYPIYYLSDYDKNVDGAIDFQESNAFNARYNSLTQTKQFDPSWDESYLRLTDISYPISAASYYQGNVSVQIYTEKPDFEKAFNWRVLSTTPVQTTLGDRIVNGEYIEYDYDYTEIINYEGVTEGPEAGEGVVQAPILGEGVTTAPFETPSYFARYQFQDGNNWYIMEEYSSQERLLNGGDLRLVILTAEEAKRMSQENLEINESYPVLISGSEEDFDNRDLMMPGDLSELGLSANSFSISEKPLYESKCVKYHLGNEGLSGVYTSLDCLVEYYGGHSMTFSTLYDSSTEPGVSMDSSEVQTQELKQYNYLNYYVVDINKQEALATLGFEPIGDEYVNVIINEISGKTVIAISSIDQARLIILAEASFLNKDREIVKEQLQQFFATSVFPVSSRYYQY